MDHRLEPGTRLGPFEVLGSLGRGGMGEVYRARDTRLGRDVALKTLPAGLADQPGRLARLRQEARVLAGLSHPHIATLLGLEEGDGTVVLVIELIEGPTLADRVRLQPPGAREALEIARQVAAGLEAAHDKGVLHRDLKPANIVIDGRGQVKLLDFGLAATPDADADVSGGSTLSALASRPGGVVGTVPYMSPEQARGERLDKRTDVWSFGCVLYELLAGTRAFPGASAAEVTAAILDREPDWTALPAATPPAVRRLLERCLQKDRVRRLRDLGDARLELDDALAPGTGGRRRRDEASPYPGLAPFTEGDAGDFFGREADVAAAWTKLRTSPLLAVIGPSGTGKTSFVRAGLAGSRPADWAVVVATPGDAPLRRLGQALAPDFAGDRDALALLVAFDDPQTAYEALRRWRARHAGALLVVDQFEELFTLNPPEVQARFAALLGRVAVESDVHVVLALRDDFLMACQQYAGLVAVFDHLLPLGPPQPAGLRRALVEPAARRGYRFEDEALVDEMLAVVEGERGALPLLGFATAQLWERRDQAARLLTRRAYAEIGGVGGALARHADATLDGLGADRQGAVREIFRNLVTTHGTRAAIDRPELLSVFADGAVGERVLDTLIGARLLTTYDVTAGDGATRRQQVEIVHESLLTAWPRLVRWQAQDAEGAVLREQLRQAAHAWNERGRLDDLLWTGTAYREYQVWRERYPGALTELEEAFAKAMTTRALRRRRLQRIAVAAIVSVLAIGLVLMGTLWWRGVQQVRRAEAAKLLALGRLQLDDYPTAAVAYATRSVELADTLEARRFAIEALWKGPTAFVLPLAEGNHAIVRFSRDGSWLATAALDDKVTVWPSTGAHPMILGGHESPPGFAFGPTSDLLATNTNKALRIWSLPQGSLLRTIPRDTNAFLFFRGNRVLTVAETTSPELRWVKSVPVDGGPARDLGRLVMTGVSATDIDLDGTSVAQARGPQILMRPLEALASRAERLVGAHAERVGSIAFGPDHLLLSRDEKGEIRVWSLTASEGRLLCVLKGPASGRSERLDGTGSWIAQSDVRTIHLYDLTAPPYGTPLDLRRGDAILYRQLDFATTTGEWLAASHDTSVSFWPLSRRYARVFAGHTDLIRRLVFAPDGSWVATTSHDSTVRVWPLDANANRGPSILARASGERWGFSLAVDPSGRRLLATFGASPPSLIDPAGNHSPVPLDRGGLGGQNATAFDHEGHFMAVGTSAAPGQNEMVIRIWDAASGRFLKDILLPDAVKGEPERGGVRTIEFAPDGHLYSAGWGGIRRWNVDRGTSEIVAKGPYMIADLSRDGRMLLAATRQGPSTNHFPSVATLYDLEHHISRPLTTHGTLVTGVALDPTGRIVVTGSGDGVVRVGTDTGEEPHLLFGHRGLVVSLDVSPDGKWIASGGQDGALRLWPMPDLSKPPLHTLPHDVLLATLRSLTNLRVNADAASPTGYRLDVGPFPGWAKAPTW